MSWRPLTLEDAPMVAAVAGADELALRGRPSQIQANDVEKWWERTDLESSSWVYEEDGSPLAFGWFELYGDIGTFIGVVAQGAKGRGLGTALADRGEERAREAGSPKIHTIGLAEDTAAAALFAARGFHEVRRFYEMAIELDGPPPEPELPDGLVLEEVGSEDMRAFHDAVVESFQDHWEWHAGGPYEEWLEMRRDQHHDDEGPLWFLIRDDEEVAAVVRNETNRNGGGYVGAIGVRRPWRGQGLAKALLYRTFGEFHRRGVMRVTLGVDAQSPTGATHLYERVGMEVESSMVVYEKAP